MKMTVLALLAGLAAFTATGNKAEALPCLDGIKTYCDGPPAPSWAEYFLLLGV